MTCKPEIVIQVPGISMPKQRPTTFHRNLYIVME